MIWPSVIPTSDKMMQLLEDVPAEVYNAYFPRNIVASNNLSFREAGNNISTSSVFPAYFPRAEHIVCAEDPEWDRGVKGSGLQPPRLSTRAVQVLAKYFSHKPNAGSSLKGKVMKPFIALVISFFTLFCRSKYNYWRRRWQ